ncbi:ankyrin repeat domain-containing protein 27 isoform X1 [Dermacentor silvarum]|uniref:ankyrin repeat domain-containing protein 27 isoform X1 n=1 Tax=Dermacentor silvarum TaxID=543639 RepID=UPI0021013FD1|nr:ankyrin repeat domain-containing protein 27 isoform X1 [Dermacentor silvarum]
MGKIETEVVSTPQRRMSADDLESNPFYKLLQTTYRSKYEDAQANCWLVCVPHASSLKGVKINSKFVDAHILRPSPLFKGQYTFSGNNLQKSVEVDGAEIKAVSGFPHEFTVKILGEELCYNRKFKQYRVLTISRPFEGASSNSDMVGVLETNGSLTPADLEKCLSYKESLTYLRSLPEHVPLLKELDRKLESFCGTYMILPAYLHDTAQKLKDIVLWAVNSFQKSQTPPIPSYGGAFQRISLAAESYVMGAVHQKVFGAVKQFCRQEDAVLVEKLRHLHSAGLSPDQLGVRESFCCPLPRSVVELASLDSKMTPLEKLWCLKTTLKMLSEEIYDSTAYSCARLKNPNEQLHLTSDDLIPILACLIVRCKLSYLESNLYYIQNFSWNLPEKDMLGYTLVTFQAAKEFLRLQDTSHLQPSHTGMRREITPTELMQVTARLQISEKKTKNDGSSSSGDEVTRTAVAAPKSRPIDRQLEQAAKLIEASTSEFHQRETEELQELFKNGDENSKASIGDFLSGLQDSLGVTYGKL